MKLKGKLSKGMNPYHVKIPGSLVTRCKPVMAGFNFNFSALIRRALEDYLISYNVIKHNESYGSTDDPKKKVKQKRIGKKTKYAFARSDLDKYKRLVGE